jgi:hypothetical protein
MKIIPIRGTNIGTGIAPVHAPGGVPVECPDALARELIAMGLAHPAPEPEPTAPAAPPIETAQAPAAPERAIAPKPAPRRAPRNP